MKKTLVLLALLPTLAWGQADTHIDSFFDGLYTTLDLTVTRDDSGYRGLKFSFSTKGSPHHEDTFLTAPEVQELDAAYQRAETVDLSQLAPHTMMHQGTSRVGVDVCPANIPGQRFFYIRIGLSTMDLSGNQINQFLQDLRLAEHALAAIPTMHGASVPVVLGATAGNGQAAAPFGACFRITVPPGLTMQPAFKPNIEQWSNGTDNVTVVFRPAYPGYVPANDVQREGGKIDPIWNPGWLYRNITTMKVNQQIYPAFRGHRAKGTFPGGAMNGSWDWYYFIYTPAGEWMVSAGSTQANEPTQFERMMDTFTLVGPTPLPAQ